MAVVGCFGDDCLCFRILARLKLNVPEPVNANEQKCISPFIFALPRTVMNLHWTLFNAGLKGECDEN